MTFRSGLPEGLQRLFEGVVHLARTLRTEQRESQCRNARQDEGSDDRRRPSRDELSTESVRTYTGGISEMVRSGRCLFPWTDSSKNAEPVRERARRLERSLRRV